MLAAAAVWHLEGNAYMLSGGVVSAVFAVTLLGPIVTCTGVEAGLAVGHAFRSLGFASVAVLWGVPFEMDVSWICVCIGTQVGALRSTGSRVSSDDVPVRSALRR